MATTDFRFDLGATSLNFIATVGSRLSGQPVERLGSAQRLSAWIQQAGLSNAGGRGPKATEADLQAAIALREAMCRLVHDLVHGAPPRRGDLQRVNAVAAATRPAVPQLTRARGGAAADWVATTPSMKLPELLSLLARDVITTLGGPDRAFLRECEGKTCDGIYIDRSPGGRRRWCSSLTCGNSTRVERFRAKAALQNTHAS